MESRSSPPPGRQGRDGQEGRRRDTQQRPAEDARRLTPPRGSSAPLPRSNSDVEALGDDPLEALAASSETELHPLRPQGRPFGDERPAARTATPLPRSRAGAYAARSTHRARLVANFSLFLFAAALLVAGYLTLRHPECQLHTQVSDDLAADEIDVAVVVETDVAAEVIVADQHRSLGANDGTTLHFRFPYQQLKLGENLLPVTVRSRSGRTLVQRDVTVLHELELRVENVELSADPPGLHVRYATPPGWQVEIADRPVASSGRYRLLLADALRDAERRGAAVASISLPLRLERPDGSAREHIERIRLDLRPPRASPPLPPAPSLPDRPGGAAPMLLLQ